jgi:hypothetical protein
LDVLVGQLVLWCDNLYILFDVIIDWLILLVFETDALITNS